MMKFLVLGLAAAFALTTSDPAFAAKKKHRSERTAPLVQREYDGTPIIMKGYRPRKSISIMKDEPGTGRVSDTPSKRAAHPRGRPRGSSTYIPPPVPSPSSSLPAPALVQPAPQVYQPPKINSFGDRVTNCIHSYPLNRGIGNNPTDQQAYIRQCAN